MRQQDAAHFRHRLSIHDQALGAIARLVDREGDEEALAIGRELGDVSKDFERWIQIELPKINKMLEGRGLPRIEPGKVAP